MISIHFKFIETSPKFWLKGYN